MRHLSNFCKSAHPVMPKHHLDQYLGARAHSRQKSARLSSRSRLMRNSFSSQANPCASDDESLEFFKPLKECVRSSVSSANKKGRANHRSPSDELVDWLRSSCFFASPGTAAFSTSTHSSKTTSFTMTGLAPRKEGECAPFADGPKALSSEVDAGSRKENASERESKARF
jgi:hypothetical protein